MYNIKVMIMMMVYDNKVDARCLVVWREYGNERGGVWDSTIYPHTLKPDLWNSKAYKGTC